MAEKKKKRKGLIIFLSIILVVIVLPIGLIYGLFYDGNTRNIVKDETFETEQIGETMVVDSMDFENTNNHVLSFKLKEDLLNQAFLKASEQLDEQIKKIVRKVYVDIQEDCYKFYIDVSVPMFKTRACLITKLSYEEENILFHINDVKVGRLGGFDWLIKKFVNDQTMEDLFSSAGLSIKSHLNENYFSYNTTDLVNDLERLNLTAGDNLYFVMLKEFINDENLISYDFYSNDALSVNVNLDRLHSNDIYDSHYDLNLDIFKVQTKTEADIMANPNFDKTDINIKNLFESNFQAEFAATLECEKSIKQIVQEEINASNFTSTTGSLNIDISEEQINDYLKDSEIIGNTVVFHRQDKDNYKVNFLTVDNFYVNLYKEETTTFADFVIGLNVTGFETVVGIKTKLTNSSGTRMEFSILDDGYRFGQLTLKDDLKREFVNYLINGFDHNDDTSLSLNSNQTGIILDFQDAINGSNYGTIINNHCDISCNIYGETASTTDAGVILSIQNNN